MTDSSSQESLSSTITPHNYHRKYPSAQPQSPDFSYVIYPNWIKFAIMFFLIIISFLVVGIFELNFRMEVLEKNQLADRVLYDDKIDITISIIISLKNNINKNLKSFIDDIDNITRELDKLRYRNRTNFIM
jgi:hypothetical protein